jgi:hypothetical protein
MPTPIAYQKIQTSSGTKDIPLYNPADVSYSAFRIQTTHGLGCYDLITPTAQTPLRISTAQGIKGINTVVASGTPLNFASYSLVGGGTTLDANTVDYMLIHSLSNGNGIAFPFTAVVGNVLNATINVDITQSVDDVVGLRIWNVTKALYINASWVTGIPTSGAHTLTGSYTLTSTNFTNGDTIHLRVVQSWKNSTNDDFKFKVMKTSTLSVT